MSKILVLYDSTYGHIETMAQAASPDRVSSMRGALP
jgi:hypothetical protein